MKFGNEYEVGPVLVGISYVWSVKTGVSNPTPVSYGRQAHLSRKALFGYVSINVKVIDTNANAG